MKKLLLSIAVIGVLASCEKKQEAQPIANEEATAVTEETTAVTEETTPQEAVTDAWVGVYEGTLPCADCEGIETTLTLNADNTYQLHSNYIKKESFDETGKLEWDATKKYVTLKDDKDPSNSAIYMVADDGLYLVSAVGDTEAKPDYKLAKKS